MDEENAQGLNESTDTSVGEEVNSAGTSEESSETGYNPNWKEAFDVLPDEYTRNQVKPVFEKWDSANNRRYEELQNKFNPYNELIEHGVDMERIKAAFEFQNQVASKPEDIFKALGAHLGYDMESIQNALKGMGDESEEDDSDEIEDPRLAELRKTQEGMIEFLAQQEAAKQEAAQKEQESKWFDETSNTLTELEGKYGKFDRNRVVREALMISEQTGKPVDFEAGVRSLAEFSRTAFQNSPSANAPGVFSGNGNLASGRVDTKKMNDSDFEKYAIAEMARINGQQAQ